MKLGRFYNTWVRYTWCALAISLLILGLLGFEYEGVKRELEAVIVLLMIPLSYPLGLLVYELEALLRNATGWDGSYPSFSPKIYISLVWLPFAVLGYLQWFVIVPYLSRRIAAAISARQQRRNGERRSDEAEA